MEPLKKLIDIGRQHYEKMLLTLVLFGLAGAVLHLSSESQKEKEKIRNYLETKVRQAIKPVPVVDLSAFEQSKSRLENPEPITLTPPHNLFNPVKWQRRPDGTLFKIQSGKEIGPYALTIKTVRPLHLSIAIDRPAGSGFWIVVTNETAPPRSRAFRVTQFASLAVTNTQIFTLRGFQPQDDPTEWTLELADTGENVVVTKEAPYQRVEGYEADLNYAVEEKDFKKVRLGDKIRLSGEDYNIVAINPKEVLLSANSNDRRYAIPFSASP